MKNREEIDQQNAISEAEETAAMEGVFATEPEVTEVADPEPVTEQPATEGEPAPEPEKVEPKFFTQDEVMAAIEAAKTESKAEISKMHDRVFGKIGDLQQRIDTIRATANISPKAKEKLAIEFPELAQMLFDDEPIPTQLPRQDVVAEPVVPQVDVDELVSKKLDETTKSFEKRILKRDHPDWEAQVETPEFATWRESVLSPEDAATLSETWDADFISAKLTEFKEWKVAHSF